MTSAWRFALAHPMLAVFTVALLLRLVGALIVAFLPPGSVAIDDDTYQRLARQMADGETGDWTATERQLYERTATLLVPVTGLYWLFGDVDVIPQLLVVLVGAATAPLVVALIRQRTETKYALLGGLAVAVMPSQIAWASVLLKDPVVWTIAAALALAVTRWIVAPGRDWIGPAGLAAVLLFLLGFLRLQSTLVVAWSMAAAVVVGSRRDMRKVLVVLALAVLVPWIAGGGPAGLDPLLDRIGALDEVRAAGAQGAESGIDVTGGIPEGGESEVIANLTHLPRGLGLVLVEPLPWAENRNARVALAKLDHVLWYPVLAAALLGMRWVRRDAEVLLFPTLVLVGMAFGYALTEGNLGTAFRHRGELVWAAVVVGAIGVVHARAILGRGSGR